jgi:trans-aconitate 2-methyltransferase
MSQPHTWDPATYLQYADERGRPFLELVARVRAEDPRTVVDLGCGPGNLTVLLAQRWPRAQVTGLDSSAEMISAADKGRGVTYAVGHLRGWRPGTPVDVLVSNAALQWVPGHLELLPSLLDGVAPGGWLAFQVPGNFDQPSHTLRRALAEDARFAPHLTDVATPDAFGAEVYLDLLAGLGCEVDAWETTYLHVLPGDDPVFDWVVGTGARPTLAALPDDLRPLFASELRAALRTAYPRQAHGTVLPFRRVFVVARRPAAGIA